MAGMRITWRKAVLALTLGAVGTAPWTAAAVAERVAKAEAEKAGVTLDVAATRVRPWRVELDGVTAEGRGITLKARRTTIELDGLRPKHVLVSGATVRAVMEEGKAKEGAGRTRERPLLELEDSTVSVLTERAEASLRVRTAALRPDGRASFFGDVTAKAGRYEMSATGVMAKDLKARERIEATAESVHIKVAERVPGTNAERTEATGSIPEVAVKAERASVEAYGRAATAERVSLELSSKSGRTTVNVEAKRTSAEGTTAEGLALTVSRIAGSEGETEVDLAAERLETADEKLSKGEFSIEKLRVRADVKRIPHEAGERLSLERANVRIGGAEVSLTAWLSPTEFRVDAEMPEVDCQQLLDSLPANLVPKLHGGTDVAGTIAWRASVEVDLPAKKKPGVSIWLKNRCVVKEVPEPLRVSRLKKVFTYQVYSSSGKKTSESTGPGGPDWVPLSRISPYMPLAVMATEDPAFMSHRGILIQAIENSMEQNITAGKFVRGGSTISMQLAKNLWLAREKTISRKLQEAFLVTYLEQKMTKTEILEYYLNVVEFGPDLYGIGPAARRYFSKDPMSLTLSQSLYLASLLPSPRAAGYEEGKKISQGRLDFLRKVMKQMLDRGTIDQGQYEQGVRETPVFGDPSATGEEYVGVRAPGGIDPSEWR